MILCWYDDTFPKVTSYASNRALISFLTIAVCVQTRMQVPYGMQAYCEGYKGTDTSNQHHQLNSSTKGWRVKKWPTKIVEYAVGINTDHGHLQYQVHAPNP